MCLMHLAVSCPLNFMKTLPELGRCAIVHENLLPSFCLQQSNVSATLIWNSLDGFKWIKLSANYDFRWIEPSLVNHTAWNWPGVQVHA